MSHVEAFLLRPFRAFMVPMNPITQGVALGCRISPFQGLKSRLTKSEMNPKTTKHHKAPISNLGNAITRPAWISIKFAGVP